MNNNEFGIKELEQVVLKSTYPIEINGQIIEPGEVIACFDKIQIANFKELTAYVTAHGGYMDAPRVFWETTKEVRLNFTQGIFSRLQFALMSNSKLISSEQKREPLLISQREVLETDENGYFELKREPVGKVFSYTKDGEKIGSIDAQGKRYKIENEPFLDLIVDYSYEYENKSTYMVIGQRLITGYLTLEGKTRVKDDITGQTRTGIIKIPKLKLMSDLSMRLGEKAAPVIGQFDAIACPIGIRNNPVRVMELVFLEDDIDSDI